MSGFTGFYRPNGGGQVYLNNDNTGCFESWGFAFNQGDLYVTEPANLGSPYRFASGQPNYATAGYLNVAATQDLTFPMRLEPNAPSQESNGLKIKLENAGPLVTFSGDVAEAGTKDGAGTRILVDGPGDGRFTGNFLTDRMAFYKQGSGTWTLGSEIESCALTGLVTVASGALRIDCTVPTKALLVKGNAHLGGSGVIGPEDGVAQMSFEQNTAIDLGMDVAASVLPLTFRGTVTLAASVTINLPEGAQSDPSGRTLLLSYGAKTGVGIFVVGANFPAGTVFSTEETALYAVTPTQERVWTGETSGVWDTETANFAGGTYSEGLQAVFPDLADEAKRTVAIPTAVHPQTVIVRPGAGHDYVFTGEGGVVDALNVVFDGPGTTTWQAPIVRVNTLEVRQGTLVLDGDVSDTTIHVLAGAALELRGKVTNGSILVDHGGAFEQAEASVIDGTTSVTLRNDGAVMRGANAYTGGLVVGERITDGLDNPTASLSIYHAKAIGEEGDVTICFNSVIDSYVTIEETDRTLVLEGYNQNTCIRMNNGTSLLWYGDIQVHSYIQTEAIRLLGSGGQAKLGKLDGSSVFSLEFPRNITFAQGPFDLYAAYVAPDATLGSRGILNLYNTNSQFRKLHLAHTKCYTWAKDVIPPGAELLVAQTYLKNSFYAELHLNGFDQTISKITPMHDPTIPTSVVFESDKPAKLMLTDPFEVTSVPGGKVTNYLDSANVDLDVYSVTGALTLCKAAMHGTKWTIGMNNTSTGDLEIIGGTLSIAAPESMPVGRDSTFRIAASGATLDLPDGVAAVIARGEIVNGARASELQPGLYGGADCTVPGVTKVSWITGTGTLKILRGKGLVLIFR